MIENVSTQLTVFHCFAHCLLPGRAFASLYVLLFLEKEAEIGGRDYPMAVLMMSWLNYVMSFMAECQRGIQVMSGIQKFWSEMHSG